MEAKTQKRGHPATPNTIQRGEKINCECGNKIVKGGLNRHLKTKIHNLLMKVASEKVSEAEKKKKIKIEFVKEKLSDQLVRLNKELEKKSIQKSKKKKKKIEEEMLEIEKKINILTL